MDANQELQNMRFNLQSEGYDSDDIDTMCDGAAAMISEGITSAIADALRQAEQIGQDMGADDFLSELRVDVIGSTFIITTDSGRTDFSEPPFPMLPSLLKNAKTAKDGSRYKRIPISGNKGAKSIPTSTMQATERMRDEQTIAKEQILDDVMGAARSFAGRSTIGRAPGKQEKRANRISGGTTQFATASSKQDSMTKWVMPAKDYDLSAALANINSELSITIDQIIINATQSYRG